jgi:hypothetical protein
MILSQLIIAFEYMAINGIIVIRLGNIEWDRTVAVLYLLSLVFETVKVLKPQSSHDHRGLFYAVAAGFQVNVGNDPSLSAIVQSLRLRMRWWEATFGGESGNGTNPMEWWRQIFSTADLPELFGKKLIRLAKPVWEIQTTEMKRYFRKHGIEY